MSRFPDTEVGHPLSVHHETSSKAACGMTQIPAVPAESGLYPIIDIDGQQPRALTDFIGAVTISVAVAGSPVGSTASAT